jgi:hypothetical protein
MLTAIELATLGESPEQLSDFGRLLTIPLRLIAPLLFLQYVLALRSRIHRRFSIDAPPTRHERCLWPSCSYNDSSITQAGLPQ